MLGTIFNVIVKELNHFFQRKLELSDKELVLLEKLIHPDGKLNDLCAERIVCSVVNIQEENLFTPTLTRNPKKFRAPVQLSVGILFAANLNDYTNALDMINEIVNYFNGKPVFTPHNTPVLPNSVEKITAELLTLTFEQQNHLWGSLGGHYLPSVVFKFRILALENDIILEELPGIGRVELPSDSSK